MNSRLRHFPNKAAAGQSSLVEPCHRGKGRIQNIKFSLSLRLNPMNVYHHFGEASGQIDRLARMSTPRAVHPVTPLLPTMFMLSATMAESAGDALAYQVHAN